MKIETVIEIQEVHIVLTPAEAFKLADILGTNVLETVPLQVGRSKERARYVKLFMDEFFDLLHSKQIFRSEAKW